MSKYDYILLWKILFLFVAMLFYPYRISQACGPVIVDERNYSLLDTALYEHHSALAPYIFNFESYYKQHEKIIVKQEENNLTEWRGRFCDLYPIADIKKVIYRSTVREMKDIRKAAARPMVALSAGWNLNGFAKHLVNSKCLETIDYLIFAKRCEPYVIRRKDNWERTDKNLLFMEELIEEGLEIFEETGSHYIRLRLIYQLVRLAHYSGDYEGALQLYDLLLPKIDVLDSIINYWILGHKAGALQKLGRNAESAYLFATIFRACPEKRQSAYLSFKITTDEEWEDCYRLCKNDVERASLYAMRAHAENGKSVEEMEKIYALDPKSIELESLLCKEMIALEKDFLGASINPYGHKPRKNAPLYLINLKEMVSRFIRENKVVNLSIWLVTDAYLELLSGDFYATEKAIGVARKLVKDEVLLAQIDVVELALKIDHLEEPDNEDEEDLGKIMREDVYKSRPDFENFLFDKLNRIYTNSGQEGKAFLSRHGFEKLHFNPDAKILELLLKIAAKPEKNRLEKRMLLDEAGKNVRSRLLEMKGTLLLASRQPEAALKVFSEIPRKERASFNFDPFYSGLKDCVHCPARSDTLVFTRASLVEKMLQLEYDGRADLNIGARHFYRLGLAWYNTSYYGNSWEALDFYRSGANWGKDTWKNKTDNVYYFWDAPGGNREFKNLDQAIDLFEKTRLLARSPELAARATFMAAKCEHINYFNSEECSYSFNRKKMPDIPDEYQHYFEILQRDYPETKFYAEAIKECKYFKAFVMK